MDNYFQTQIHYSYVSIWQWYQDTFYWVGCSMSLSLNVKFIAVVPLLPKANHFLLNAFVILGVQECSVRHIFTEKEATSNTTFGNPPLPWLHSPLTHLPLVLHISVSELGQHCFRQWLVVWSARNHYLNQWWLIVNWTLRKKNSVKFKSKCNAFYSWKCTWKSHWRNSGHFVRGGGGGG